MTRRHVRGVEWTTWRTGFGRRVGGQKHGEAGKYGKPVKLYAIVSCCPKRLARLADIEGFRAACPPQGPDADPFRDVRINRRQLSYSTPRSEPSKHRPSPLPDSGKVRTTRTQKRGAKQGPSPFTSPMILILNSSTVPNFVPTSRMPVVRP